MPHSHTQITLHVIYSTKDRAKSIPRGSQRRLWEFIGGICRNLGIIALEIGGVEDHVHMLLQIPATTAVADAVSKIKANSSRWAHRNALDFSWQDGYGAFSVSASAIPAVIRYIRNQEAHHRKQSFRDEWTAILKRHGMEPDSSD